MSSTFPMCAIEGVKCKGICSEHDILYSQIIHWENEQAVQFEWI